MPPQPVSAAPSPAEKLISLDVKDVRFSDAMLALAKQGHFNFVADAYLLDFPVSRVQLEAVPLHAAIKKLAELFDRKISVVNGVCILTRSKRALTVVQDKFQQTQYGQKWETAGQIIVIPAAKLRSNANTLEVRPGTLLPPFVSVEANAVSAFRFTEKLTDATDWAVYINKELAERRLSAYFENTPLGEVTQAVSTLFYARQRVVIEQSDTQIKQDAAFLAELADQRNPLEKSSNALQPKIMKLLTKDQQDNYNKGNQVEVLVAGLPAELQKAVEDYIALSIAEMDKTSGFAHPDPNKGYILMLMSSNSVIAVIGFAPDGTRIGF